MKLLSLDISSKTGWAILEFGENSKKLVSFGRIEIEIRQDVVYPSNIIDAAERLAKKLAVVIDLQKPDAVVIEERCQTSSKTVSRYSIRVMEFMHYAINVLLSYRDLVPVYMESSGWRGATNIKLTPEQRAHNKLVAQKRAEAKELLKSACTEQAHRAFEQMLEDAPHGNRQIIKREMKTMASKLYKESLRKLVIAGTKGERLTKTTLKHAAVKRVNDMFGLKLLMSDNDVADAILLGVGYYEAKQPTQNVRKSP